MIRQIVPARAFLSHASKDKRFVQQVFDDLGPTLAEIDQVTFEPGKLNWDVILRALDRSGVFVLFASQDSLSSDWVANEIAEALTRLQNKKIKRILVYCLDKTTFKLLDPALKRFNIVRLEKTPLVCARQIRGVLAEVFSEQSHTEVFVSRDENVAELKRLVIDPSKDYRTLAVSGFDRLGRRTLVRRFCQDIYGSFNPPSKSVMVETTTSLDDVFRDLLNLQYGAVEQTALVQRIQDFSRSSELEQAAITGQEIRAIYNQREFAQFVDAGGLLGEEGDLSAMMQGVVSQNADIKDLLHILILYRNPPEWAKRKYPDTAFYRLPPLSDSQAETALLHELKTRRCFLSKEDVLSLNNAIEGHPANIDYVVGYIFQDGDLNRIRLGEALDESSEFANWKRARATAYVGNFAFSATERLLVGLLVRYRALPTEVLARYSQEKNISTPELGRALGRLLEFNLIDVNASQYRLIRPLRDALERDSRFNLNSQESDEFAKSLVANLESYGEGDSVPIALIDSASIAAIRAGAITTGWVHQLVLPSHYIWLSRESYHKRDYPASLDYALKALNLSATMTHEARLEALRFAGLSSARLGLQDQFQNTIQQIGSLRGKRAVGSRWFLEGLNARLEGRLENAQTALKKANEFLPGSIDVQRELIGVFLARRDFPEALSLAKALIQRAGDNPFVLDGYLQARIAVTTNVDELTYDAEFVRRLDQLEAVGDGPGLSFFALRRTDLALKRGDVPEALKYAARAVHCTEYLPAAHAAQAKAFLAADDYDRAWAALQKIEELGSRRHRVRDRLEKLALYQVRFDYNLRRSSFDFCRSDIENIAQFDPNQARSMKLDLVHRVMTSGASINPALAQWLKTT